MNTIRWIAPLIATLPLTAWAGEAPYPTRPIRMIVPFAAGGGTDVIARLMSQRLAEGLNIQVVVDNRGGGGSVIGSDMVAHSAPDGHTLLLTANPHTANPSLVAKLPYDTQKDFAPVSLVAQAPLMMVVHPSVPTRSVKQFIALAKSKPGQLTYGTSGNGGPQHYAGELFKHLTGTDIIHIPYKGGAPATTDLLGGQVQLMFNAMFNSLPHMATGRMRALAITSAKRSEAAPDVPTVAESLGTDYEVVTWYGVFAQGQTPQPIVKRINEAIVKGLAQPAVIETLSRSGVSAVASSPEQFTRFVSEEIERFRKVARAANMRIE